MHQQIPPERAWFMDGVKNALNAKETQTRTGLMSQGKSAPKYDMCFLYGVANTIAGTFYDNFDSHIDNINSFFFIFRDKKKRSEAEALNELGIAEEILTRPEDYINKNSANMPSLYRKELLEENERILNSDVSDCIMIQSRNKSSLKKIDAIGKKMLNLYAGVNIEEAGAERIPVDPRYTMMESFDVLRMFAEKGMKNEKELFYPYASKFMQEHIIKPYGEFARKFNNEISANKAMMNYFLNSNPFNPTSQTGPFGF